MKFCSESSEIEFQVKIHIDFEKSSKTLARLALRKRIKNKTKTSVYEACTPDQRIVILSCLDGQQWSGK